MRTWIASVALCAGCVVETEVTEVCATRHDVPVEGERPGDPIALVLEVDVALTDDERATLERFDASLRFRSVRLHATSGLDDLGFVEAAELTAAAPGLPAVVIGACDRDCQDGDDLLVAARDVDARAYLAGDHLTLAGAIRGDLPAQAWTVDVEVCAGAD